MVSITCIFTELGRRMGSLDAACETVKRAAEANPWFTPDEICRSAEVVARRMLSPEVIAPWLALYPALPAPAPKNVSIVMAGNIPFVGVHDLLCVLASGHRAVVKPSSKDRVLMSWVVEQLLDIAPELPVSLYLEEWDDAPVDAVIAMGGDDAIKALRRQHPDIQALLRGSRHSLAVLRGDETSEETALLADDILACSGLGCRNVSLLMLPEGYDMSLLAAAIGDRSKAVNPKYRNSYRQTRALLAMTGVPFTDCGCSVLCRERSFPAEVSRINYTLYSSPSEVAEWIEAHDNEIQCVAGNVPLGRNVAFGQTQSPSLTDYPDGCDTMNFLAAL